MNHPRSAFAEFLFQAQRRPWDARRGLKGGGIGFGFQRVTGIGQPGQGRQGQQPLGQFGKTVGEMRNSSSRWH